MEDLICEINKKINELYDISDELADEGIETAELDEAIETLFQAYMNLTDFNAIDDYEPDLYHLRLQERLDEELRGERDGTL
jgi:hypothetical protein